LELAGNFQCQQFEDPLKHQETIPFDNHTKPDLLEAVITLLKASNCAIGFLVQFLQIQVHLPLQQQWPHQPIVLYIQG